MKIERIRIRDLRGIEHLDLDLRDEIGVPRDLVVLAGPNGCGKTTILDAISAALTAPTQLTSHREDMVFSPRALVRVGAAQATVALSLTFSAEERAATEALYAESGTPLGGALAENVQVQWCYPDPLGKHGRGFATLEGSGARELLGARVEAARRLKIAGGSPHWFRQLGRVCMFDQRRTGLERNISPQVWRLLGREGDDARRARKTSNPRDILLDLAIRAELPGVSTDLQESYEALRRRFSATCGGKTLEGPRTLDNGEIDVVLRDGAQEYGFDGLSSGELMILSFLIRMATERVHRSIVLVDEVELHLHPTWQRRFLHALPKMGDDNQIIVTTHSDYLRDAAPAAAVLNLGELLEGS